uniref:Uncharacterized protein n=1 Tax=Ditylum brightwellii TaxID=49249 RepID=A0A7S1VXE9_9STRA|mmetsp:Transcript_1074/g.1746  ORF Transcript_1074/g.1746 Transcript_1074/m.1746 type:complete len:316 (+) Transcript_1074:71-1018(+)
MTTQGEHSTIIASCPATQALDMMISDPFGSLPWNSLASSKTDQSPEKMMTEMKTFPLSGAQQGSDVSSMPFSTSWPIEPSAYVPGASLVSPSPSFSSLQKAHKLSSVTMSSSVESFDLSDLARAADPVEASIAFPVIEWASDDEEDCCENDDDKSFVASCPISRESAQIGIHDDDNDDDDDAPVLFRPGSAPTRKRRSDDMNAPLSSMHRTKSRRSCLNALSEENCRPTYPSFAMAPMPSSFSIGYSLDEDEDTHPHPPSPLTVPQHGSSSSSWGQFIQSGTDERKSVMPVLFAVSLTSSSSRSQKSARRFSRSY